jgi:hypothetical protein
MFTKVHLVRSCCSMSYQIWIVQILTYWFFSFLVLFDIHFNLHFFYFNKLCFGMTSLIVYFLLLLFQFLLALKTYLPVYLLFNFQNVSFIFILPFFTLLAITYWNFFIQYLTRFFIHLYSVFSFLRLNYWNCLNQYFMLNFLRYHHFKSSLSILQLKAKYYL